MLNLIWKKTSAKIVKIRCVKKQCSFIIARRIIRQLVKMIIWLSSYYHVIILILCFKKYLVSLIDRQKRIPLVCIRFQISWNWYFIRKMYNKSGHMMIAHYLFKILSLLVDNLTFPIYKLLNITYQHKFTPKDIEIYN